jgi:hypothetical protein
MSDGDANRSAGSDLAKGNYAAKGSARARATPPVGRFACAHWAVTYGEAYGRIDWASVEFRSLVL